MCNGSRSQEEQWKRGTDLGVSGAEAHWCQHHALLPAAPQGGWFGRLGYKGGAKICMKKLLKELAKEFATDGVEGVLTNCIAHRSFFL